MEISTEINKNNNIRCHTIKGLIDASELIGFFEKLYSLPDFDLGMKALWDLREADFSALLPSDIRSIMDCVGQRWGKDGKSKAAIVASRDLDYGMSRMFQIMLDGETTSKVTVFKDINKAEEWLVTV